VSYIEEGLGTPVAVVGDENASVPSDNMAVHSEGGVDESGATITDIGR
jgi:hypothetical protein